MGRVSGGIIDEAVTWWLCAFRFLEQRECKISVISWQSGKLTHVARSSHADELQAAADAEGKLTYVRFSL